MHAVDRFVVADDCHVHQAGVDQSQSAADQRQRRVFHRAAEAPPGRCADQGRRDRRRAGQTVARARCSRRSPTSTGGRRPSTASIPLVERVVGGPFTNIADMARASLREVCEYLDMTVSIVESSAAYGNAHLQGAGPRHRHVPRRGRQRLRQRDRRAGALLAARPFSRMASGCTSSAPGCRVPAVRAALRSVAFGHRPADVQPAEEARELSDAVRAGMSAIGGFLPLEISLWRRAVSRRRGLRWRAAAPAGTSFSARAGRRASCCRSMSAMPCLQPLAATRHAVRVLPDHRRILCRRSERDPAPAS